MKTLQKLAGMALHGLPDVLDAGKSVDGGGNAHDGWQAGVWQGGMARSTAVEAVVLLPCSERMAQV